MSKFEKIHLIFICGVLSVAAYFLAMTAFTAMDTQHNINEMRIYRESQKYQSPIVVGNIGSPEVELANVEREFKNIQSLEDKKLIYKLFSGAASYLSVCQSLDGTHQFDPILGRVQSSYGWKRDKYPAFTTAVSEYLISVGYDKPKSLESASDRFAFAKIFQDLAEATKNE